MAFTNFFSSLNPFSTTYRKRRPFSTTYRKRQQKHNRRTRRRLMRGGWGEPIPILNKKFNVMKGGWGGVIPLINNV